MNNQPLVKGVTQLYGRVFDHHAVLQSEINIMKELDTILQSSEKSAETLSDQVKHSTDTLSRCEQELPSLLDISSSLVSTKLICDTVFLQADTHQKIDYLAKERNSRVQQWDDFMAGMKARTLEMDNKYYKESEAVRQHYKSAEDKLNLTQNL